MTVTTMERDETTVVRAAAWVFTADALVYGIFLLLVPQFLVETLADAPTIDYFWVRWSGGILLALAFGAWRVAQDPRGHKLMFETITLAPVLAGVGLFLAWVAGEYQGAAWFLWLTLISSLGVGAAMIMAGIRGTAILD